MKKILLRSTGILAILILGSGYSGFFALNMERSAQKRENLRDFSALPPGSQDYSFSGEKAGPAAVTIQEISGKVKGLLRDVIVSMDPSNGNILVVFNKSKSKKQEYGQIWGVEGILQVDGSYEFGKAFKIASGKGPHQRPRAIWLANPKVFVINWDTGPRDPFSKTWKTRASKILGRTYRPSWVASSRLLATGKLNKQVTVASLGKILLYPVMLHEGTYGTMEWVVLRFTSFEVPDNSNEENYIKLQYPFDLSAADFWGMNHDINNRGSFVILNLPFMIEMTPFFSTDSFFDGTPNNRNNAVIKGHTLRESGSFQPSTYRVNWQTGEAEWRNVGDTFPGWNNDLHPQHQSHRVTYDWETKTWINNPGDITLPHNFFAEDWGDTSFSGSESLGPLTFPNSINPPAGFESMTTGFPLSGKAFPAALAKKNMTMIYFAKNGAFNFYNFSIDKKKEKINKSKSTKLAKIKKGRLGGTSAVIYDKNAETAYMELKNNNGTFSENVAVAFVELLNKKGTKSKIKFFSFPRS